MKHHYVLWGCALLFACAFWGCGKDGSAITGPKGPQGPPGDTGSNIYYGDIVGTVKVYDTIGVEEPSFAGVKVSIDSTNLSLTTDAAGNFRFRHVRAGVYNLTFFKDSSYGITRIRRLDHNGGAQVTQLGNTDVGAIYKGPRFDFLVLQDPSGSPTNPHFVYWGNMDYWILHSWAIVTFYGVDSTVSASHFLKSQREQNIMPTTTTPPFDGPPEFDSNDDLDQDIIRSDTTLILSSYLWYTMAFDNPHKISYIDEHGQEIHPCVGPLKTKGYLPTWYFQSNPYNP